MELAILLDKLLELLGKVVMEVDKVPMEEVDKVCPIFLDKLLELLDWVDKVAEGVAMELDKVLMELDKVPMEEVIKDFCGLCKININILKSEETELRYFTVAEITELLNKRNLDQLSERIDLSRNKDNSFSRFALKILETIKKLQLVYAQKLHLWIDFQAGFQCLLVFMVMMGTFFVKIRMRRLLLLKNHSKLAI